MAHRDFELDGALALVTGAGSGIGRATSLELARAGARVLAVDIDEASAKETAGLCADVVGDATRFAAYAVDVADGDAMVGLAARVHAEHGPLDVLINNAGVGLSGRFLDTGLDDWDWIIGVNLRGVINGCHAFAPAMVERRRGHVVNMSSGLGYTPTPTEPAYVATKAAVLALSQSLRADWHAKGVGVSAVCPGVINTPIIDHTRFRGDRAEPDQVRRTQRLFRRGHKPELVARAVVGAIRRNRSVVPVGFEARIGWILHRLVPESLRDRMARSTVSGN